MQSSIVPHIIARNTDRMHTFTPKPDNDPNGDHPPRRFLRRAQIDMIEEALASVGDYGEVHLIVEKGRLRFLVTHRSFDALKWYPGCTKLENG
jgi:hypothetical protein